MGMCSGVSAGDGQGLGGTMEVRPLTIGCHEGRPPAGAIFAYPGCRQPVTARPPCPGSGPAEEARPPSPAGGAARRRDRGGHHGLEIVRRDRAAGGAATNAILLDWVVAVAVVRSIRRIRSLSVSAKCGTWSPRSAMPSDWMPMTASIVPEVVISRIRGFRAGIGGPAAVP